MENFKSHPTLLFCKFTHHVLILGLIVSFKNRNPLPPSERVLIIILLCFLNPQEIIWMWHSSSLAPSDSQDGSESHGDQIHGRFSLKFVNLFDVQPFHIICVPSKTWKLVEEICQALMCSAASNVSRTKCSQKLLKGTCRLSEAEGTGASVLCKLQNADTFPKPQSMLFYP